MTEWSFVRHEKNQNMEAVARINRLFGVDGEVFINLYNTFPAEISLSAPLFIKVDSLLVPLYLEKFDRRGRSNAQVRFADIDTERRVTEFLGQELYFDVAEDVVDVDDEFFMEDLVGFSVTANGVNGELTAFYDSPHNPLFGVAIDECEVLVPAAEEFISFIDFEGRHIDFSLPEGLLDL